MDEFLSYIIKRLYLARFLFNGLSFKKIWVLGTSFLAMLFKMNKSGMVPSILIIKLTSRCNFSCIMCPKTSRSLDFYKNPVDIDFNRLKMILEENADYITLVQLHGGEPLMHRQIKDILDLLNQLNLMYTITTNGHYLTAEIIQRITYNCLRLIISIDAVTPDLYSKIRVGGDLDTIINNIQLLNQIKRTKNSSLPVIRIVMAVFKYNISEMTKLIQLCRTLDIDRAIFQEGILYDNPDIDEGTLIKNNLAEIGEAVRSTEELARKLAVPVRFDFDYWNKKPADVSAHSSLKRCFYLYFTMLLQERFNITYCFGSYDHVFPMGKNLRESWNGSHSHFYSARKDLRNNIIPVYCQKAYDDEMNCILNVSE